MSKIKFIVAYGNPFNGLLLYGPFEDSGDAVDFVQIHSGYACGHWDVIEIIHPNEIEKDYHSNGSLHPTKRS
jgi:hypothetical protein